MKPLKTVITQADLREFQCNIEQRVENAVKMFNDKLGEIDNQIMPSLEAMVLKKAGEIKINIQRIDDSSNERRHQEWKVASDKIFYINIASIVTHLILSIAIFYAVLR